MTKREFEAKKALVEQYLKQAKKYAKVNLSELSNNTEKRLAIERALFLVAQSSIDLAESFAKQKNLRRGVSMHEAIDILQESGVIDNELCEKLLKMVGFRNVLTHGYAKLDYKKVHEVLRNSLKDVERLLKAFE